MKTLSFIATLLLVGCVRTPLGPQDAYEGQKVQRSNLAWVRSGLPQYRDPGCPMLGNGTIQLLSLDGKKLYEGIVDPPRSILVLPGSHKLELFYITGAKDAGFDKTKIGHAEWKGVIDLVVEAGDIINIEADLFPSTNKVAFRQVKMNANDCWPGDK